MFNSNDFILANLAKLKNAYGEIDEEALSNLLDVFRDNLRIKFDENETFANYEAVLREQKFEERAKEYLLSLFTQ
jgi:hypothetical protein